MLSPRKAVLVENRQISSATYFLRLRVEDPFYFEPGQFLQINCSNDEIIPVETTSLTRPFCIFGGEASKCEIYLLVRERGPGSSWLTSREAGDFITFFGPCGHGYTWVTDTHPERFLLVGEAIGVVQLAELSHRLLDLGKQVTLVATAQEKKEIPDFLFPQSPKFNYQVEYIFRQPAEMEKLFNKLRTEGFEASYLSLAPATYPALFEAGVIGKEETVFENPQIYLQKTLSCGIGICGQCNIDTLTGRKLVCEAGPVFRLNEIVWRAKKVSTD